MTCKKCGAEISAGMAFCSRCGAQQDEPSVRGTANPLEVGTPSVSPARATKACPFCGEEIFAVALKCRFCGSDLSPSAASLQHRAGSNIVLNAPQPAPAGAVGAVPSIVIQNVQASQAPAFVPGRYKNPAVAALLSLIFPGGGQFYNGHAGKGILILLTFWLIIPWIWGIFDAYSCAQRINRVGF